MKKFLLLLSALFIFAGCSDSAGETSQSSDELNEQTTAEESEYKPKKTGEHEGKPEETMAGEESGEESVDDSEEPDLKIEAEANASEHPAAPGKKLYDEEFKGMNYHFKGELVKTEMVEGLFGEMEEALLVKNENGFVLVIFPPYEIEVSEGDEIEVWGPLSGDGYASSDLGVDNVVGVTGAMNASIVNVNGEMQ